MHARNEGIGGPVLDVHELGATLPRPFEQGDAGRLVALEAAALPDRPAGDDDGEPPAGQRVVDIHVGHAVQTQLDQVGAGDHVAATEEFGHRRGRDGGAQSRGGHNEKRPFNRRSKRRWSENESRGIAGYARPGSPSVMRQYQDQRIGRDGPAVAAEVNRLHESTRVEGVATVDNVHGR